MPSHAFDGTQIRVARPARNFAAVTAFYSETLGLPIVGSFEGGVIFGLPDASRQLELMQADGPLPAPSADEQLVFYLGSTGRVADIGSRIAAAGHEPQLNPNPYWEQNGAVCFVDPDGYWLILSPQVW